MGIPLAALSAAPVPRDHHLYRGAHTTEYRREVKGHAVFELPIYKCCGSGMFIPDPDFYPYRIPDPTTALKEEGE
jgi:hypothetical protein